MTSSRETAVAPSSRNTSAISMLLPYCGVALLKRWSNRENTAASNSTIKKMPSQTFHPERVPMRPSSLRTRRSWAVTVSPFSITVAPSATDVITGATCSMAASRRAWVCSSSTAWLGATKPTVTS